MRFAYKGNFDTASKKVVTGVIEAPTREAALETLKKRAIRVSSLERLAPAGEAPDRPRAQILDARPDQSEAERPKSAPTRTIAPAQPLRGAPAKRDDVLKALLENAPESKSVDDSYGLSFASRTPVIEKPKSLSASGRMQERFGPEFAASIGPKLLLPEHQIKRLSAAILVTGLIYFFCLVLTPKKVESHVPFFEKIPYHDLHRVQVSGVLELPSGADPKMVGMDLSVPEISMLAHQGSKQFSLDKSGHFLFEAGFAPSKKPPTYCSLSIFCRGTRALTLPGITLTVQPDGHRWTGSAGTVSLTPQ
jgi:hypothetical protein